MKENENVGLDWSAAQSSPVSQSPPGETACAAATMISVVTLLSFTVVIVVEGLPSLPLSLLSRRLFSQTLENPLLKQGGNGTSARRAASESASRTILGKSNISDVEPAILDVAPSVVDS